MDGSKHNHRKWLTGEYDHSDYYQFTNEVKDLSKRVETLEKQMKEDKEEQLKKLKAEIDYAKLRCALSDVTLGK